MRAVLLLGCLLPAAAGAAGLELTPVVGWRAGGGFDAPATGGPVELDEARATGLVLGVDQLRWQQIEIAYSRQPTSLRDTALSPPPVITRLTIETLHVRGVQQWDHGAWRPFLGAGVGLVHLRPGLAGVNATTRPSLSLGGGIKWFPGRHLGLRLEARALAALLDSGAAILCGPDGCLVEVRGDGFVQWEVGVGISVRF